MQLQIYPSGSTVTWTNAQVKQLDYTKDVPIELIEFDDLSRMAYKLGTRLRHWIITFKHLTPTESATFRSFLDAIDGADTRLIFTGYRTFPYPTYVVRCLADGSQFKAPTYGRYEGQFILQEYVP